MVHSSALTARTALLQDTIKREDVDSLSCGLMGRISAGQSGAVGDCGYHQTWVNI